MANKNNTEVEPIHKYFRGKWKDLKYEEEKVGDKITPSEYKIKDLDDKSVIELEELISRQQKMLKNEAFLHKLKDKGKKIQEKYNDLKTTLQNAKERDKKHQKKDESDPNNVNDINLLEWGGNSRKSFEVDQNRTLPQSKNEVSEGEEESNPLQLLARHSVEYPAKGQLRQEEEDPVEAIQKELERLKIQDAQEQLSSKTQENHTSNYFGDRLLQVIKEKQKPGKKEPFKPNRPLKKENPGQETKDSDDLNEPTNMTATSAKLAQLIPLQESLRLMAETHNSEILKMKSEAVKVLQTTKLPHHELPTQIQRNYRDTNAPQHLLQEFEDELEDYFTATLSEGEEEDDE